MTSNEKLMRLLREFIEAKTAEAVKAGADPAAYDLGFPVYRQELTFTAGDIYRDAATDQPFECLIGYDGSVQPDWTLSTPSLWRPFHGKDKDHAYPWAAPTGAHDIYKTGEHMTYTDGKIYRCVADTNYSPTDYPTGWEMVTEAAE